MATQTKYCVRGTAKGQRYYKVSSRRVVRSDQARGEDLFDSKYDAIHNAAQALHAMPTVPEGMRFDVVEREVPA